MWTVLHEVLEYASAPLGQLSVSLYRAREGDWKSKEKKSVLSKIAKQLHIYENDHHIRARVMIL